MQIELIGVFGILLAAFGAIGLAVTADNRHTFLWLLATVGLITMSLSAFAFLASMSVEFCASYGWLCSVDNWVQNTIGFPSTNESLRTKTFFAMGFAGPICMLLFVALAEAKTKTFKILTAIGATAMIAGFAIQLFLEVTN